MKCVVSPTALPWRDMGGDVDVCRDIFPKQSAEWCNVFSTMGENGVWVLVCVCRKKKRGRGSLDG